MSPLWRPHSCIQCAFWRIESGPQPLFLFRRCGKAWEVFRLNFCRVLVGGLAECLPSQYKYNSKIAEKAPQFYVYFYCPFHQLIQAQTWFGVGRTVCSSPVSPLLSVSPPLITQSLFTLLNFMHHWERAFGNGKCKNTTWPHECHHPLDTHSLIFTCRV